MRRTLVLLSTIAFGVLADGGQVRAQPEPVRAQANSGVTADVSQAASPRKRPPKAKKQQQASAVPVAPAVAGANLEVTNPNFSPEQLLRERALQEPLWFLRRDPTDLSAYQYFNPGQPSDGKGGAFSFTNDLTSRSRVANIQAFAGVVLPPYYPVDADRSPTGPIALAAAAVAPFVWLSGTLTDPRKPTERSLAQFGVDAQFEFWRGGLFSTQDISLRPYLQTDFRGEGRIAGLQGLWEPYKEQWHLGARYDMRDPKLVGVLWRVIGEFDSVYVDKPGLSDFTMRTAYAWLGGTVQVRAVLFENLNSVPEWLCGRVFVNGAVNYFWDANSGRSITDSEAAIGYSFASSSSNAQCSTSPKLGQQLKPTISLVYNNGTQKSTLEKREQYKAVLSVQF